MELDAVSQPELERIERAGGADLVVGILDPEHDGQTGGAVADGARGSGESIRRFTPRPRGRWCSRTTASMARLRRTHLIAETAAADGGQSPAVFAYSLPAPSPAETSAARHVPGVSERLRGGGKLGARACGVIASRLRSRDSAMDLPPGPTGAGAGVRSGGAALYPPEDGRSAQQERPLSAAPRALRRAASESRWVPISDSRESSCIRLWGRIPVRRAGPPAILWRRSLRSPRAAVFRFANRTWAYAPSRPPTG